LIADFLSFLNEIPDEPQSGGQDAGLSGQSSKNNDEQSLLNELAAMLEGDTKQTNSSPVPDSQQIQSDGQQPAPGDSTSPTLNFSDTRSLLGALLGMLHPSTTPALTTAGPASPDRKKNDLPSDSSGAPVSTAVQSTTPVMPLPMNLSLSLLQFLEPGSNKSPASTATTSATADNSTLTLTLPTAATLTNTQSTTLPPPIALLASLIASDISSVTTTLHSTQQNVTPQTATTLSSDAKPADPLSVPAKQQLDSAPQPATASVLPTPVSFTTTTDIQPLLSTQSNDNGQTTSADTTQTQPQPTDMFNLSALLNYQIPQTTVVPPTSTAAGPQTSAPLQPARGKTPMLQAPPSAVQYLSVNDEIPSTPISQQTPQAAPPTAPAKNVEASPIPTATPNVAFTAKLTEASAPNPAPQTNAAPAASQPTATAADGPVKSVRANTNQSSDPAPPPPQQSQQKDQAADPSTTIRPDTVTAPAPVAREVASAPIAQPPSTTAPPAQDPSTTAAAPTRFQETQQVKPAALNEISVRVAGPDQSSASIRVVNQGSELHVSVRASDEQLAASLRGDVEHLASRLDANGWNADIFKPVTASATTRVQASAEQTFQDRPGSDNRQQSQDPSGQQQQNNGRQRRPEWAEEYEQWQ